MLHTYLLVFGGAISLVATSADIEIKTERFRSEISLLKVLGVDVDVQPSIHGGELDCSPHCFTLCVPFQT